MRFVLHIMYTVYLRYLTCLPNVIGAYLGSDRVLDESSVLPKSTGYLRYL